MRIISTILISLIVTVTNAEPKIEEVTAPSIEFLGEKTGPVEDELKSKLSQKLKEFPELEKAYLAIIAIDNSKSWSVALCLKAKNENKEIIESASEVFYSMFSSDQFLDMLFLSEDDDVRIQETCQPFYTNTNT